MVAPNRLNPLTVDRSEVIGISDGKSILSLQRESIGKGRLNEKTPVERRLT